MHPKYIHLMLHATKLYVLGAVLEFKDESECIIWGVNPEGMTLQQAKQELESTTKAQVRWHRERA